MRKRIIIFITAILFVSNASAQKGNSIIIDTLRLKLDTVKKVNIEKLFIRKLVKQYDSIPSGTFYLKTYKIDDPGNGRYESVKLYNKNNQLLREIHFNKYFEPDSKKDYYYLNQKLDYILKYDYAPEGGYLLLDSTHVKMK